MAALADHHRVKAPNWEANRPSWYSQHNGTCCDELQIEDLEGRWEQRELGYRISFISLSSVGIAAVIVASALGRRAEAASRRRPPSPT